MMFEWAGVQVHRSSLLPIWSRRMKPMALSPRVPVSEAFRVEMNAWLKEFFGEREFLQEEEVHAIRALDPFDGRVKLFVSPEMYDRLEREVKVRSMETRNFILGR